jgi:hypothetical protein
MKAGPGGVDVIRRNGHVIATLLAVAAVIASAGTASASSTAGRIPSNPCRLKISRQLHALRLAKRCTHTKPVSALGKVTLGTWGAQPHVLGIGFFAFADNSKREQFRKSFLTIGKKVKHIGSGAAESITPDGVAFAAIVKGIGINLSVNEASASSATKAKDAKTVLALVKAITHQL